MSLGNAKLLSTSPLVREDDPFVTHLLPGLTAYLAHRPMTRPGGPEWSSRSSGGLLQPGSYRPREMVQC